MAQSGFAGFPVKLHPVRSGAPNSFYLAYLDYNGCRVMNRIGVGDLVTRFCCGANSRYKLSQRN